MRDVIVPKDVKVIETRTGKPVLVQPRPEDKPKPWIISHEEFVLDVVCSSQILIRNGVDDKPTAGLQRQQRIQDAFKNCQPGQRVPVREDDWAVAMDAIKNLSWAPDAVRHAAQLLPHVQAWEDSKPFDLDSPENFVCYCPSPCKAHPKGDGDRIPDPGRPLPPLP